jgi:hypothetical protein
MTYLRLVNLTVLLFVATGSPAHADRIRIDTDLSTLLAGSTVIAHLRWSWDEDPILSLDSFNHVLFDGSRYTYLYGVNDVSSLDSYPPRFYGGPTSFGDEPKTDFIELQSDLPRDVTWGFVVDFNQFDLRDPFPGPRNAVSSSNINCAAPTAGPDPLGCTSGWVRGTYDPFTLEGDRLAGRPPFLFDANFFYVQSDNAPIIVPLHVIYSSQAFGAEGTLVLGWAMQQASADVYAPNPIPEPGTLTLMLSGLGAAAVKHYRGRARQRRASRCSEDDAAD